MVSLHEKNEQQFFNTKDVIFTASSANQSRAISVAVNGDNVVFKTPVEAHIYVMAICAANNLFVKSAFTC